MNKEKHNLLEEILAELRKIRGALERDEQHREKPVTLKELLPLLPPGWGVSKLRREVKRGNVPHYGGNGSLLYFYPSLVLDTIRLLDTPPELR